MTQSPLPVVQLLQSSADPGKLLQTVYFIIICHKYYCSKIIHKCSYCLSLCQLLYKKLDQLILDTGPGVQSHMTYMDGSRVLTSWPGIWMNIPADLKSASKFCDTQNDLF
jgi:hypothetical protein